jgi:hypothetical protein
MVPYFMLSDWDTGKGKASACVRDLAQAKFFFIDRLRRFLLLKTLGKRFNYFWNWRWRIV